MERTRNSCILAEEPDLRRRNQLSNTKWNKIAEGDSLVQYVSYEDAYQQPNNSRQGESGGRGRK